jgi:hypothetical protein
MYIKIAWDYQCNMMKDLPNITFRVPHDVEKTRLESLFDETWNLYLSSTVSLINDADADVVKSFLKTWVFFVFDNLHIEDPLKDGAWNEYFLNCRFPRFVVRSCIHIGS